MTKLDSRGIMSGFKVKKDGTTFVFSDFPCIVEDESHILWYEKGRVIPRKAMVHITGNLLIAVTGPGKLDCYLRLPDELANDLPKFCKEYGHNVRIAKPLFRVGWGPDVSEWNDSGMAARYQRSMQNTIENIGNL